MPFLFARTVKKAGRARVTMAPTRDRQPGEVLLLSEQVRFVEYNLLAAAPAG